MDTTLEFDEEENEDSISTTHTLPHLKNYITLQGHARLKEELEQLIRSERPRVVESVAWAASNGDRSENADYIYGKKRLREIDRRIRFLYKRIDIAVQVDPARQVSPSDQIFFGATVILADNSGVEQKYSIVGVDEVDLARGHISWISPLARALLKAREGDVINFKSNNGMRVFSVQSVDYVALD